ncbi:MAG TPA: hydantoinase/oxoprolinase family protein, partial [Gammaproteobacteria bacterium]|nr:hydantoinase/oxoprolinase family protein [Gammaproteobacteria bacterium]
VGAQYQARASGRERLMTFDMGGTSTDVALIDGEIGLTSESEIAGYPVAVPMVDMHTIGAGGGSIAWLDDGGMLQVGPQSAGADPGPACYGKGGARPTVTDAHVVLGHLPPSTLLGGSMALDRHAAEAAVSALAARAGLEMTAMARGILRIADEHMAQALRVISVQRGHDPREFTLVSFGGAGGLHICSLAEQLNMSQALVPAHGGVLSALGMVVARPARELSHAIPGLLENATVDELDARFTAFEAQLAREMNLPAPRFIRRLDCRYQGQSSVLSLAWRPDLDALEQAFHQQHRSQFGHALNNPIELVNLRLRATTADSPPDPPPWPNRKPARPESHADTDAAQQVPVYPRSALAVGQTLAGPAIISESIATTWLAPGWQARMDEAGNLMLTRI